MNYYFTFEGDEVSAIIESERTYFGERFVPTTREEILERFPGYTFKPDPVQVEEVPKEESDLEPRVAALEGAVTTLMDGLV